MAIWQFAMKIIPRKGVLRTLGGIPTHIDFGKTADFWADFDTNIEAISACLDKLFSHYEMIKLDDSWWKTKKINKHHIPDNDAAFTLENGQIIDFGFRADLREPQLKFLKNMVEVCAANDLLLIDLKNNVAEPTWDAVKILVKKSDAYLFLTDEDQFWRNFEVENSQVSD